MKKEGHQCKYTLQGLKFKKNIFFSMYILSILAYRNVHPCRFLCLWKGVAWLRQKVGGGGWVLGKLCVCVCVCVFVHVHACVCGYAYGGVCVSVCVHVGMLFQ